MQHLKKYQNIYYCLIGIAIPIITFAVVWWFYKNTAGIFIPAKIVENLGQFGDYFGGVLNPIFNFYVIVILVLTLKFQSDAHKTTKEEIVSQKEMARLEQFKSTFFNF